MVLRRVLAGIVTLLAVSILVFLATQVLPGNAAYAILGHTASPHRIHALEAQLHLNRGVISQYWSWLSGLLEGHPGTSLVNGRSVDSQVLPRLENSGFLMLVAGLIGTTLGLGLGALAAFRKDGLLDHALAILSLTLAALPEFVVAITLVLLFSTNVFHLLPGVSFLPPGEHAWDQPKLLILPVATLVLVITPYIARMMRASMIEALESEYVEMARLKGVSPARIVLVHALPNAIAPAIQVVGIVFLYLAGGIIVVEYIFNFPGIGSDVIDAVSNRDIPSIQFIVVVLAAFYVFMNILTDVVALAVTPRRRTAR
jgi:peptide/nickel transport system permease protein